MSTDTPSPEDVTPEAEATEEVAPVEETPTPEEELQAATPEAPADEPVAAEEPAAEAVAEEASADAEDAASDLPELTLGDGAPAETEEVVAPLIVRGKIDRFGVAMGTGRRKTSVARVRIKDGNGEFVVNGKPFEEFFCVERDRKMVQEALTMTEMRDKVDVWVRVNGGGTTGQTGAVILGVARALQVKDPSLHHVLASGGYLTRDDRMVERKKYGRRKARRGFQFSKR
ncbi:MAG: small subunit ribosomal protein S9 [Planctomycetaceae bacterium]|jgi:small subunit ribosomal protein S9